MAYTLHGPASWAPRKLMLLAFGMQGGSTIGDFGADHLSCELSCCQYFMALLRITDSGF